MEHIKYLELGWDNILREKEITWWLKNMDLWLSAKDQNTKKKQSYANDRKNVNMIWKLEDD